MSMRKFVLGRLRMRGRRDELGQALVEAAVAAPLFFVLLLGAAELARVAYMAIEVANAARAGAQYASQNEKTLGDPTGITLAAQSDGYNLPSLSVTSSNAYTCADGTTGYTVSAGSLPSCTSGATAIPTVTVNTSAVFDPLVHIPALPSTFTLSSSATATCLDCQ